MRRGLQNFCLFPNIFERFLQKPAHFVLSYFAQATHFKALLIEIFTHWRKPS